MLAQHRRQLRWLTEQSSAATAAGRRVPRYSDGSCYSFHLDGAIKEVDWQLYRNSHFILDSSLPPVTLQSRLVLFR